MSYLLVFMFRFALVYAAVSIVLTLGTLALVAWHWPSTEARDEPPVTTQIRFDNPNN